jgi:hypothetical protein
MYFYRVNYLFIIIKYIILLIMESARWSNLSDIKDCGMVKEFCFAC